MKLLSLILLCALLMSSSQSVAQLPSQQRSLRQFVEQVPSMVRRLVPSSWRNTLVGMAVAGSLLLASIHPSPAVAQGLRPIGHHIEATRPEHLSVVTLMLNFNQTWRDSHLVYVGHGVDKRALFLGMRVNITTLPLAEAELMLDTAKAWLFDHEGLVEASAVVKEVEAFLRPDGQFVRLHDITLLAIEGIARYDY